MNFLDNGFNLILVYMITGMAGTIWETLLYLVKEHRFVFSNGSIATPFNFVYGLGGAVICASLSSLSEYPFAVYLVGCLLGGATEYLVSVIEEVVCHTRSWDYTGRLLSIKGRTTVPIMLGWGLLCLFIVYALFIPFVRGVLTPNIFEAGEHVIFIYHTVMWCCLAFIVWDLFWVLITMIRHQQRARDKKPLTFIGKIVDYLFNDAYVAVHFPNAQFKADYLSKPKEKINN